jgi:hypothetical protein
MSPGTSTAGTSTAGTSTASTSTAGTSTGADTAAADPAGRWQARVEATDWEAVRAGLDGYGCGLTGPLLTTEEAAAIAAL